MKPHVECIDGRTVVSQNGDVLSLPHGEWGHPDVLFKGNRIPSARIWALIAESLMRGEAPSAEDILHEAKRSEVFRQLETGLIIWTLNPEKQDVHVQGNVYIRKEKQRIRYLADKFKVKIAKVSGDFTPEVVRELNTVCLTLGMHPVGCVDGRIYYSRDPEAVFKAFGTRQWVRVGIFCKRPSSSSFVLDIEDL